jgi:uncharacterized membrane protein HdeD (DUF308 family)
MDIGLVVLVILTGIIMILGVILMISHAMQLRDRPGVFIFSVLGIIALIVFFIWLLAAPHGPSCGNVFNDWTCVSPNP